MYNENHGGYIAHSIGSHKYLKREKINGKYRYWYYNVKKSGSTTSRDLDQSARKSYNEAVKNAAAAEKNIETGKVQNNNHPSINKGISSETYYDKDNHGSQVANNMISVKNGRWDNASAGTEERRAANNYKQYENYKKRSERLKKKEEESMNSVSTKLEFAKYTVNQIKSDTKKRGKKFLHNLIDRW